MNPNVFSLLALYLSLGSFSTAVLKAEGLPPAMSRSEIEAGLKSHDRALRIKSGWIRDPYITIGPDGFYYLTGTQPNPDDQREATDPNN